MNEHQFSDDHEMTTFQAAAALGVPARTIARAAQYGALRARRVGSFWILLWGDCVHWYKTKYDPRRYPPRGRAMKEAKLKETKTDE